MNRADKDQIEQWFTRLSGLVNALDQLRDEVRDWVPDADDAADADEEDSLSSDIDQVAEDLDRAHAFANEAFERLEVWNETPLGDEEDE